MLCNHERLSKVLYPSLVSHLYRWPAPSENFRACRRAQVFRWSRTLRAVAALYSTHGSADLLIQGGQFYAISIKLLHNSRTVDQDLVIRNVYTVPCERV